MWSTIKAFDCSDVIDTLILSSFRIPNLTLLCVKWTQLCHLDRKALTENRRLSNLGQSIYSLKLEFLLFSH